MEEMVRTSPSVVLSISNLRAIEIELIGSNPRVAQLVGLGVITPAYEAVEKGTTETPVYALMLLAAVLQGCAAPRFGESLTQWSKIQGVVPFIKICNNLGIIYDAIVADWELCSTERGVADWSTSPALTAAAVNHNNIEQSCMVQATMRVMEMWAKCDQTVDFETEFQKTLVNILPRRPTLEGFESYTSVTREQSLSWMEDDIRVFEKCRTGAEALEKLVCPSSVQQIVGKHVVKDPAHVGEKILIYDAILDGTQICFRTAPDLLRCHQKIIEFESNSATIAPSSDPTQAIRTQFENWLCHCEGRVPSFLRDVLAPSC